MPRLYDSHETLSITVDTIWLRVFSSKYEHEYQLMLDVSPVRCTKIKVREGDYLFYDRDALTWIQNNADEAVLKVAFKELREYIEDSYQANLENLVDALSEVEKWKNWVSKKLAGQSILKEIESMQGEINKKRWEAHRLLTEAMRMCKDEEERGNLYELRGRLGVTGMMSSSE